MPQQDWTDWEWERDQAFADYQKNQQGPAWDEGTATAGSGYSSAKEAGTAQYAQRLAAQGDYEQRLFEQQQAQALKQTQLQMQNMVQQGQAGLYGAQAGRGAMGLRSAAYGAGDLGQRGSVAAQQMASMEQQALREQYLELLARKAQYEAYGQEADTMRYGIDAQTYAQGKALDDAEQAAEIQRAGQAIGIVGGMVGSGMAAGSDESYKRNARAPGAASQDEAVRRLAAALDAEAAGGAPWERGRGRADALAAELNAHDEMANARAVGPVVANDARSAEADAALRHMDGKMYEYRPDAAERTPYDVRPGQQYGPMADDLRKTPVGRAMLTPDGKGIEYGRAVLGTMGLTARLGERADEQDERIRRLEAALGEEDARTTAKLRRGGAVRAE